jgi:hypothetical protein
MSLRFTFALQVSNNHLLAAFHLEISVAFPQFLGLPVSSVQQQLNPET